MSNSAGIRALLPQTSNQVFKLLFFLLPIIYFLLYGWYGFDDTDQGFILSLSYRITNGEIPHQDFLYVRPPLTPLLHSLEMMLLPENIEVIGMRFFGYVYLWLSVLFSVLALRNTFNFDELKVSPWVIGCLGFFISMHNYPPMAWHTIDGALFTALGAYFFSKAGKWYWLAAALVAWGMAPLAKQPFAVVPLFGFLTLFLTHPWQKAIKGVLGAAAFGALVLALLYLSLGKQFLLDMLAQSTGATEGGDILWPGLKLYIWPVAYSIVPLIGLWAILKYRNIKAAPAIYLAAFGLAFAVFYGIHIVLTFQQQIYVPPRYGTYHALLAFGFAAAGYFYLRKHQGMPLIITMCFGGWAAGISWGYPAPVHYMIPGIFMVLYFLVKEAKARIPNWYFPAIAAGAFVCYFLMYQFPFREPHREGLTYHLGDLFPKFNYVYTHKDLYDKYADMKQLHAKYGDNFSVLPAMPIANYLTNTTPPYQIDWAHDAEIAYEYGLERILPRLEERRPVIFVDKVDGPRDAYERTGHYRSQLTAHVLDEWTKLEETPYYEVYKMD